MDTEKFVDSMLRDIESEVTYTRQFIGKDKLSDKVINAIRSIPRHEFVPENQQKQAYLNGPLCIGYGQTISQPYIVALMTDLLDVNENSVVLDIGTGSGYQTAILARLVKKVFTMEVIPELLESARKKFLALGYTNIDTRLGDGHRGWPEHSPYDGIIVSAAATEIPDALVEQLKPGANLVIPVGPHYGPQELFVLRKNNQGEITSRRILSVAFVPLVKTASLP